MNFSVLFAVFRRNFISYFTNATGYVFICVFALLSSFAAFWPEEFFIANLANLDQLNKYFPYIMLIFIPAITMSIWAEERREGTDELLLTIPARDIDLVLGKYFAAVAIVTVSLLFSLVTNCIVLDTLGDPDWGQMASTYVGYWLMGVAMLGIGQVASLLTKNLTIAYILGVLFNAPLIFIGLIGSFLPKSIDQEVTFWGFGYRLVDFGNGVISLGGIVYFGMIAVVMLYLCVILVGYRRWIHFSKVFHYTVRVLASVTIGVCICVIFRHHDVRWDWTANQLSSLSKESRQVLNDLKEDQVIQIEAFISPEVPTEYVQTRRNLLNMLREIEVHGGGKVRVKVYDTKLFTKEADLAVQRYGIKPKAVPVIKHGIFQKKEIFLGVAIQCGLNRTTIPFFHSECPVEYELVHSIYAITGKKPFKVGVLLTDAAIYGRFNSLTGQYTSDWPILRELEKQYEVILVDPSKPIKWIKPNKQKRFDAILTVQPSSLNPVQMDNFIAAIKQGIPTAIFEDPAPASRTNVLPTLLAGCYSPKGDISKLWKLLGVDFCVNTAIWQDFNPYPQIEIFIKGKGYVFIDAALGREKVFGHGLITSSLRQLLLMYTGAIQKSKGSKLKMEPLVSTGKKTGTIGIKELIYALQHNSSDTCQYRKSTNVAYLLAAHITGTLPAEPLKKSASGRINSPMSEIDVILVADVDVISPASDWVRGKINLLQNMFNIDFRDDNVSFLFNVLDALAGDDRFLAIHSRCPYHPVLTKIDEETKQARFEIEAKRKELEKEVNEKTNKKKEELEERYIRCQEEILAGNTDAQSAKAQLEQIKREIEKDEKAIEAAARREFAKECNKISRVLEDKIRSLQNWYKGCAILLPPILPLAMALVVFSIRRVQERRSAVFGRRKKKESKNR